MVCPQDVEEDAVEASQDVLWEQMGSEIRVRGVERRSVVGASFGLCCEGRSTSRGQTSTAMWVQKRMCDIGWSDEEKCRGCDKEEGREKHRLYLCPAWREVRNQIRERLGKWEQRAISSEEDWTRQRGITSYPLGASKWRNSHLAVRRWESEEHWSCGMPVGAFRNHVTTKGSLLGVTSSWSASGWSVVQQDQET